MTKFHLPYTEQQKILPILFFNSQSLLSYLCPSGQTLNVISSVTLKLEEGRKRGGKKQERKGEGRRAEKELHVNPASMLASTDLPQDNTALTLITC